MKLVGKPYAGKPHVRFDEGATEYTKGCIPYSTLPVKRLTAKYAIEHAKSVKT